MDHPVASPLSIVLLYQFILNLGKHIVFIAYLAVFLSNELPVARCKRRSSE